MDSIEINVSVHHSAAIVLMKMMKSERQSMVQQQQQQQQEVNPKTKHENNVQKNSDTPKPKKNI